MTESSVPKLALPNTGLPNRGSTTDDVRDELPHDLDPSGFVGPYQFPDNSRRRWPGVIYLVIAAICVGIYFGFPDSPIVNVGWLVAAGSARPSAAVISITSGWRMHVDETEALVAAQGAVGFADRPRIGATGLAWAAQPPDVARALLLRRGTTGAARPRARRRDRRGSGATPRRTEPRHRRPALTERNPDHT